MDQGVAPRGRRALWRGGEPADDGVPGGDPAVEGEEVGVVGDVDGDLRFEWGWRGGSGGKKVRRTRKNRGRGGHSKEEKKHRSQTFLSLRLSLILSLSTPLHSTPLYAPAPPSPSAEP